MWKMAPLLRVEAWYLGKVPSESRTERDAIKHSEIALRIKSLDGYAGFVKVVSYSDLGLRARDSSD